MIDGTYNFDIDTPLGRKPGTLTMRTEGSAVFADIDAPVIGKQHVEGQAEGDSFTAEGTFKLLLVGKVTYSLRGKVVNDDLSIEINSSKGDLILTGTRV